MRIFLYKILTVTHFVPWIFGIGLPCLLFLGLACLALRSLQCHTLHQQRSDHSTTHSLTHSLIHIFKQHWCGVLFHCSTVILTQCRASRDCKIFLQSSATYFSLTPPPSLTHSLTHSLITYIDFQSWTFTVIIISFMAQFGTYVRQ
jgi:hypothetical protein